MNFNDTQKEIIKIGYLKWKKPIEIAKLINSFGLGEVTSLQVHNYIQGKHAEWGKLTPFCAKCNHSVKGHKRCPLCTKLVHGDEICCTI